VIFPIEDEFSPISRWHVYPLDMYRSQLHACVDPEVPTTAEVWIYTFVQGKVRWVWNLQYVLSSRLCALCMCCRKHGEVHIVAVPMRRKHSEMHIVAVQMRRPRVLPGQTPLLCSQERAPSLCSQDQTPPLCCVQVIHGAYCLEGSIHCKINSAPGDSTPRQHTEAQGCASIAQDPP